MKRFLTPLSRLFVHCSRVSQMGINRLFSLFRRRGRTGILGLSVLLLAGLLSACASRPTPLPDLSYRPLTPAERQALKPIKRFGVKVFKIGDRLQFFLPMDDFFQVPSQELRPEATIVMGQIARFVAEYYHRFPYQVVGVYGYTDDVFAPQKRRQLSLQYAELVASYLWTEGVPEARTRIRGFGSRHPIASYQEPQGSAYNRRIVIDIHDPKT